MNDINFEQDKKELLSEAGGVKNLSDQVVKLRDLEDTIKEKEEELKRLKKDSGILSGDVIPTMMTEMNISTLKLADGSAVEVKPIYGASISPDNREKAFNWLRDNDLGDLIKNEVTVSFGQSEDNKASIYANLAKGQGYQPIQKLKVEPMTLKAVVRERLESGKEMPSDIIATYAGNSTKITRR